MKRRIAILFAAVLVSTFGAAACGGEVQEGVQKRAEEEVEKRRQQVEKEVQQGRTQVVQEVQQQVEEGQ
jgi:F0F1-type ATP synthase membrane subunit b/b'